MMKKRISLKSLNYITASLGLLLSIHSADAIYWRIDGNGILRPQGDDAPDEFVPVCFSWGEKPIAVVKLPDIELEADIAAAPAYRSFQEPIRQWLQRLGTIGVGGHSTRKISTAFVVHHPIDAIGAPAIWHCDSLVGDPTTAAVRFIPLPIPPEVSAAGKISFDLLADQRAGMRVRSLPNGFLLRQLPYGPRNDAWWRVTIAGNDPNEAFTFAAVCVVPNNNIVITVEVIPPAGFVVDISDRVAIRASIEPLFQRMSHPDYFCFVPFELGAFGLDEAAIASFRSAVEDGDAVALQGLLSGDDRRRGFLLRTDFGDGWTALHVAAQNGHVDVVQALLDPSLVSSEQISTQLNAEDENGWTPLHWAVQEGHAPVARLLLGKGAKIDAVALGDENQMPIHLAVQNGHVEVAQVLLGDLVTPEQRAAQLNAKDEDDWTPLHYAAQEDHIEVVRLLLEKGAQVGAMSSDESGNWTPLHLVVYRQARQVDDQDQKPTIEAATETTCALLEKLREQGINIQAMLQGGVIRTYDEGKEFRRWLDLVRKPENAWYRDALQGAGVDVDAL